MKVFEVEGNDVLVDDEDYEFLLQCYDFKMMASYVYCTAKKKYRGMGLYTGRQLQKIFMLPDKLGRNIVVDHIDGNELNNQKANLRVCSHKENMRNRKIQDGGTSQYKGVHWNSKDNCWRVKINDMNSVWLGKYIDEIVAANVYNHKAKELYGEFALLNDVPYITPEECDKQKLTTKKKSSKYRGVSWVDNQWIVQIHQNGKNYAYRGYKVEEEAALMYNKVALELRGSKAKLNVVGNSL